MATDFSVGLSLVAVLMAVGAAPAAQGANLVPDGGFEGSFGGKGIAAGWSDNSSWADLDVSYARETQDPHSGRQCQRVTCSRLTSGAVQVVPTAAVPLVKGRIYHVWAWLRGDVGTVALQLRQAGSPYHIYVEKGLTVGRHWAQVDYLWTSSEDDPEGRLMLRFTAAGTLWIDDVGVEEVSPAKARKLAPPARKGNLLLNGGFDLGTANWLLAHPCDYWLETEMKVVTTAEGRALRLKVPAGVSFTLASDVAAVAPGKPETISVRARASATTKLTLSAGHCGTSAEVRREWTTLRATGEVPFTPSATDNLWLRGQGPVTLWLEDAELRQDGGPGSKEVVRPEAALISDRYPLSLYHCGDTPLQYGETPRLRLMTVAPKGEAMAVDWRVVNFWGKTLLSGHEEAAPGRHERDIECRSLPRGWYKATVTWTDGGERRSNESTFCLLPPAERHGDPRKSPFGAHFSVDPTGLALAKAVGCRWLRLHPPNFTKWRTVEPEPGKWDWQDAAIRAARGAGMEIVGSLDRLPRWASTAPPGTPDYYYTGFAAWMPRKWSEWEGYVAQTVRHHRRDIHIWEVWNEPNLTDWLVPPKGQTRAEAYTEILQHTYPVVKREDPTATVVGGVVAGALTSGSAARKFADDLMRLGALKLMDVFSFHDYIGRPVDEGDQPIGKWVPEVRAETRAAGRELPIICSEGGFANPGTCLSYRPCGADTVPPAEMARWMVRQYVAQWALGIDRFFFYNFFIDGSPVVRRWDGFVEGDGQPRPEVAAYATMSWLLDGATFEETRRPRENVWLHSFATPRGRIVVAWAKTGTTALVRIPGAEAAWDLMGAPVKVVTGVSLKVTDAPIYVLVKA